MMVPLRHGEPERNGLVAGATATITVPATTAKPLAEHVRGGSHRPPRHREPKFRTGQGRKNPKNFDRDRGDAPADNFLRILRRQHDPVAMFG